MSNFEKIAASQEVLAGFLASLPTANAPWDESFHAQFCDSCERVELRMPKKSYPEALG